MDSLLGLPPKLRERSVDSAVWGLKKLKRRFWKKYKGFLRDPLLYLGVGAVILFGIFFVSVPTEQFNYSLPTGGDLLAAENAFILPQEQIKESPALSIIQKNSLVAVSPPIMVTPQVLGALADGTNYEWSKKEVTEYTVRAGDNLGAIADKFSISLATLLSANNLSKNSLIQIGQKLVILPVSGVIHHVKKGDTASGIAQTYKAKADEIIVFNDLAGEGDIYVGDILIIPNGVMPPPVVYAPAVVPLASSYFICPVSQPCRVTQWLHWYNAIDFSHGKCGEPIYAAAEGEVLRVRLTSSTSRLAFGGVGNNLTILHPNGVVTSYNHIQAALVSPGDHVYQGQVIATMGGLPGTAGAGTSTGCHLHFSVAGAKNPFAK